MVAKPSAAAGATHVGRVRSNNEDAYAVADDAWAVGDGLGGHAGGEVASSAAVEAVMQALAEGQEFPEAFATAHAAILEVADHHQGLDDLGTTLVAARRDGDGVRVCNIGDSRAYLLAGGELTRITVDDNYAQALLDRGEITADEARVHPGRFWLNKALGLGDRAAPRPALYEVPAHSGRLLLCSDGLNSEVPDHEIARLLAEGPPQDVCDALVEAALEAGGRDNVTVVVLDY